MFWQRLCFVWTDQSTDSRTLCTHGDSPNGYCVPIVERKLRFHFGCYSLYRLFGKNAYNCFVLPKVLIIHHYMRYDQSISVTHSRRENAARLRRNEWTSAHAQSFCSRLSSSHESTEERERVPKKIPRAVSLHGIVGRYGSLRECIRVAASLHPTPSMPARLHKLSLFD